MSKYKLSEREKNIFVLSLSLMAVFLLYQLAFVPMWSKDKILENKIKVLERKLLKAKKKVQKAKMFKDGTASLLLPFKQKGSNEEVMSSILSAVEEAAGKGDVVLADVKPQKVRKEEFGNLFSVDLSVEGELSEVVRFIHQLQNPPNDFQIEEFNMNIRSSRSKVIKTRLMISRILIP